jgi:tetratricopeptide (TPR) repeat protein/transcriptional regulator with XRE-family HTH domain
MSADQARDIAGSVALDREFGPLLRRYRVGAGLTQEELAQRAGLSVRAVSDMERGRTRKPFLRSVRQLASALGLAPPQRALLIAAAEPEAALTVPAKADRTDGQRFIPPVPRQLPSGVARFTGRAAELGLLAGLVEPAGREAGTAVVISGTAGVGKTALAVHFAHQVAADFPDGQLYVNLRGAGPTGIPAAPEEAIRGFLTAFGLRPDGVPQDVDAQAALLRSLLADRRVLLVLDNAMDEQQVRPLLPGSAGCLTVVTSRKQMAGLAATDEARLLDLRVLSGAESVQLLAARLGGERVDDEPEAAAQVSALCARLPLALSVAAARAATRSGVPLAALADELRVHNPLDALETGDQVSSIRVVLSWSYRGLSPSAAAMFRLLGLHVGTDISLPAAASLAGVPRPQARAALGELARASLLTEHGPDRYTCHDLLRAYAAELAHAVDGEAGCHAALKRLLDYYLHTARAASQRLYPGRRPIDVPAAGYEVCPEAPADHEQALAWFKAEHAALLAAVTQAVGNGLNKHAWQIPWALVPYFDWSGGLRDWVVTQRAALVAARRANDQIGLAHAHRLLGRAYTLLGRQDAARMHLTRSLRLSTAGGDAVGQALAHHQLGHLYSRQGRHEEAQAHDRKALRLYEAAQHDSGRGWAFNELAWALVHLGTDDEALACARKAADIQARLGDRFHQALARDTLGRVQQHLGDYVGAIASYEQALSLCRELGSRYYQSLTLSHLGDTYQAVGDPVTAARTWRKALDILIELNHPDADRVRRKLPARLARVGPAPQGSASGQPDVGDIRVADVRREDRGAVADPPDPGAGELWEVLTQDRHDHGVLHDVHVRLVPGHTGRCQ